MISNSDKIMKKTSRAPCVVSSQEYKTLIKNKKKGKTKSVLELGNVTEGNWSATLD